MTIFDQIRKVLTAEPQTLAEIAKARHELANCLCRGSSMPHGYAATQVVLVRMVDAGEVVEERNVTGARTYRWATS